MPMATLPTERRSFHTPHSHRGPYRRLTPAKTCLKSARPFAPAIPIRAPRATAGSTMSVNNVDTGAVLGVGSLRANLKFYATADPNRMPIRSVKINWGDNTDFVDPGVQNYYKNHDGGIDVNKNQPDCPLIIHLLKRQIPAILSRLLIRMCIRATLVPPTIPLIRITPISVWSKASRLRLYANGFCHRHWGATVLPVPISPTSVQPSRSFLPGTIASRSLE